MRRQTSTKNNQAKDARWYAHTDAMIAYKCTNVPTDRHTERWHNIKWEAALGSNCVPPFNVPWKWRVQLITYSAINKIKPRE